MQGVSVVIPNYNGLSLFPHTLPTVFEALKPLQQPWEIIVSDDASTDESVMYLRQHHPGITVLTATQNSGFSVTVNKGVRAAKFDLVLLLNSDVKLSPDYFERLLPYFNRPKTFGVMGRIIGWEDDRIQDGAKFPYFHGVKLKTSENYILEEEPVGFNGLYSLYLSGANALIDREAYLSIGGLNELFSPFYVEDAELSIRAWRLGYNCYYEHGAVCRHKTSTTIKSKSRKSAVETVYNRNKMYLHAIHLSPLKRYLYFLQLTAEVVARFFTGRWSYFRSLFLFLEAYPQIRRSRKDLFALAGGQGLKSVEEVTNSILASIKNKKIIRFKHGGI